jgi:hypothetical protein
MTVVLIVHYKEEQIENGELCMTVRAFGGGEVFKNISSRETTLVT